jgi:eukaryotic-like serine/threonine-protein kinase
MPLQTGSRLGPYEIVSRLGAGGMGEVYKARDTRLDRTVAVKILPDSLAGDPQFRERFDREARAISQLDHPHICALYDVGQQDGTAYLVMQFLEGETLADRLARGPLRLDQSLPWAIQIADALAKAHRAGIVHRDLKPGNVMLTQTGARLLDFGLAKNSISTSVPAGVSALPTTPGGLTAQGTILGTFQYMAPEQIEGGEADARSDIWAFGCVLYEMLTGARAFSGKSHVSLIANIMHVEPPPIRQQQPLVSPGLDHIVQRCLEKDPEARWQSITDVGRELRWAAATTDDAPRAQSALTFGRAMRWAAAAALLIATGAGVAMMLRGPAAAPDMTLMKLTLLPPDGLTFTPFGSTGIPHFELSPDGRHIAFVASAPGRAPSLWIRPLNSRVAQELPGSDDAASPFWSPDGQALGFFAQGRLKTIGLRGERPSTLTRVTDPAGGTWSNDVILIGHSSGPVTRIAATTGGAVTDASSRGSTSTEGHRRPQFLPDGRHFIYTEGNGPVYLGVLDSTSATKLVEAGGTAVYASPGFLLFVPVQTTTLMAQAIDSSWKPIGAARQILDQVFYAGGSGYPPVSVSANGLLAYSDGTTVSTTYGWFDRKGDPLRAMTAPVEARTARISRDDRHVAYASGGNVWTMDDRGLAARFSFSSGGGTGPVWSWDGREILFTSVSGEGTTVLRRPTSGLQKERQIATVPGTAGMGLGNYRVLDWSQDGRNALVSLTRSGTGRDIVVVAVDTGQITPLLQTAAFEIQARFSPDGRWIAYASDETGRWEVFVEPFPQSSGSRWQISTGGGSQPVWRRDGKELFFLAPDGKLMSAGVTLGATFSRDTPRALFQTHMRPTYPPYPVDYDVRSDGQRFLINSARPGTGPVISLVTNWTAGLTREQK